MAILTSEELIREALEDMFFAGFRTSGDGFSPIKLADKLDAWVQRMKRVDNLR